MQLQQVLTLLSLLVCANSKIQWELHQGVNCYAGRGTYVPPEYVNATVTRSLDECQKLCEVSLPLDHGVEGRRPCEGVTVETTIDNTMRCWRRTKISIQECDNQTAYDTYTYQPRTGTPEKDPAVKWSHSRATSCYQGHGAKDLELYKGTPLGRMTFPECKAMCNFLPDCEGIVVEFDGGDTLGMLPQCYRRSSIDIKSCVSGDEQAWALRFDTWIKAQPPATQVTQELIMVGESKSVSCSHLVGDNCTANSMCRWCQLHTDTSRPPFYGWNCVSEAFADSFIADEQCRSPSPDPCKAHNSTKECRDSGCRSCHYTAGDKVHDICVTEVPMVNLGYCDDTPDHRAGYKVCAQLTETECNITATCGLCDYQVSTNSSKSPYDELCMDKDYLSSWCKHKSRMQPVMI